MYVCVCNAITDREIRGAAELGARTLEDLSATLGVATCCRNAAIARARCSPTRCAPVRVRRRRLSTHLR